MPVKKNSYISWLGENLVESAKNFESSLSNLLQIESKKIASILESLDDNDLSKNADNLGKINTMLCDTLKYVEEIQDTLSKKMLIGLYAMNYDDLKDKISNKLTETNEDVKHTIPTNSECIKDIDPIENSLELDVNLSPEDLIKMKDSSCFPYEIIDLDIQLNNRAINDSIPIEQSDINNIPDEPYIDNTNLSKSIYPSSNKKIRSRAFNALTNTATLSNNVKKSLDTIDKDIYEPSNSDPKVDVKFDDLIEIQIDTTATKYNKNNNDIKERKTCEVSKDTNLSDDEKSLIESFGFFKDYYKI